MSALKEIKKNCTYMEDATSGCVCGKWKSGKETMLNAFAALLVWPDASIACTLLFLVVLPPLRVVTGSRLSLSFFNTLLFFVLGTFQTCSLAYVPLTCFHPAWILCLFCCFYLQLYLFFFSFLSPYIPPQLPLAHYEIGALADCCQGVQILAH